jgi:hypothetical protein
MFELNESELEDLMKDAPALPEVDNKLLEEMFDYYQPIKEI